MGSTGYIDRIGTELLAMQLAAGPGRNVVCSPVGVAALLSLLQPGPEFGLTPEVRESLRRFEPDLAVLRDFNPDDPPEEPLLHLADHLMLIDGAEPRPEWLAAVADRATISRAPLTEAKPRLDAWAALHTGHLITEAAVTVDEETRVVLQNALLFAARWARQLTSASGDAPFHRADGTTGTANYMGCTTDLRFARGDGWRAVRLNYRADGLACDLILPRRRISPVELPADTWAAATAALTVAEPRPVQLRVPSLDLTSGPVDLQPLLERLGVPLDRDHIMPGLPEIRSAQQVRVMVTEQGTIAAALTEQWLCASFPETDPVELTLDHPFVLRVIDVPTGTALIEAAILDPAS